MKVEAVQRYLRQIALPEVGPAGQELIAKAIIAVAGDDLVAEVAARYLAAAGVGTLRLIGGAAAAEPAAAEPAERLAQAQALDASLRQSNPDVAIERAAWPEDGARWMAVLGGTQLVLRSGFDDDAMLRATVRLGIPALVARGLDDQVDLISFRRQGPCPHAPLDVPQKRAAAGRPAAGPAAVVAGTLAAAEVLHVLVGPAAGASGRGARHLALPLDGGEPRAQEIPWAPACFACGGSGSEMAFS